MTPDFITAQIRKTNCILAIITAIMLGLSGYLMSLGDIKWLFQTVFGFFKGGLDEDWLINVVSGLFFALPFLLGTYLLFRYAVPNLIKLVKRLAGVSHHPIYRAVSWYGNFDETAEAINRELVQEEAVKYKTGYITQNWIVNVAMLEVKLLKLEDITEAYEGLTRHEQMYIGPGISTGPAEVAHTYHAVIHSDNPHCPVLKISISHELDLTEDLERNDKEIARKRDYVQHILHILQVRRPAAAADPQDEAAARFPT